MGLPIRGPCVLSTRQGKYLPKKKKKGVLGNFQQKKNTAQVSCWVRGKLSLSTKNATKKGTFQEELGRSVEAFTMGS